MNRNRVEIAGRLTRDPEVRYAPSGAAVVKCGLAVNRRYKHGNDWEEEAMFVDVTLFGKRGEAFAKYHKKGDEAFLEGRLALDTWEDKNTGAKRQRLYVIADSWEFVGGKQREAAPAQRSEEPRGFLDADETPF